MASELHSVVSGMEDLGSENTGMETGVVFGGNKTRVVKDGGDHAVSVMGDLCKPYNILLSNQYSS